MDYKDYILWSLDYIEANIMSDLDLKICAKASGYTIYHFLRVFKETVKLSPADYIRKRRLTEIAKEIIKRNCCISEIAFKYGFNSKENFTRAFKAEYHILPTEYRKNKNSLKLYNKITFKAEPFFVTPEIVNIDAISLTVFPSDENIPANFWNKYNCKNLSKRLTGGCICEDYGVSVWNEKLNYFIGVSSDMVNGDASGTIQLVIPGGTYAVFTTPKTTHFNFVNTIHKTWEYINNVWLLDSEYERCATPEFESYVENSRNFSEKIYIPIKKRRELL